MMLQNYTINHRPYKTYLPLSDELLLNPDKNYLFDLSYLSILSAIGDKAKAFLQGQVTCDLTQLSSDWMKQGALCNLKGRIIALLDILDWHGVQIVLPADLLTDTKTLLAKTAMFSKVDLKTTSKWLIFGLYLQNEDDLLPLNRVPNHEQHGVISDETFCCYHLGNNRHIIVVEESKASALIQQFQKQKQLRGSLSWHTLQLQFNQFEIYPETRGLFLPHRVGLHLTDYLSFDKGCYKGQEIIARTHYRAKIKHTVKRFVTKSAHALKPGAKMLSDETNREFGEVLDLSPVSHEQTLLLASVLKDHPSRCKIDGISQSVLLEEAQESIL